MSVARAKQLGGLIALLLFIQITTGALSASQGDDRGKSDSESYAAVHQILFPERLDLKPFPQDVKWLVVVTIDPPYAGSETWFSLTNKYDGEIELDIKTPRGASLTHQLKELIKKARSATSDALAKMVQIEEYKIQGKDNAELREFARSFEAMRMSPLMPDEMIMDSYHYHFWTASQWGLEMSASLSGPGPKALKQPHPLIEWAEQARRIAGKRARVEQ